MKRAELLREVSKFLSGLILGDLLVGLWLVLSHQTPVLFFGLTFTAAATWLGIAFDAFVFTMLVHYAWHPRVMEPSVSSRVFYVIVGFIMASVALIHVLRLAFGWSVSIDQWLAPLWISWVGLLVASCLSYMSFHFAVRKQR